MMKINAKLWQAYSDVKFDIQHKIDFERYAIITAWNPNSVKLSDYKNCVNNQHLKEQLSHYHWFPLRVGDPNFNWFEESFAVEIALEEALNLARAFGQNAIYYVSSNVLYLHSCIGSQQECLGDFNRYKI